MGCAAATALPSGRKGGPGLRLWKLDLGFSLGFGAWDFLAQGERQLRAKGVEVFECVVRAKAPSSLRSAGAVHNGGRELWNLDLGISLGFGIWILEFRNSG
jgi:hypothetical protein